MLTLANETLGPERLTGEEVGVSVAATRTLTVRGTLFNNRVNNPIANVTVATNNVPVTPGCARRADLPAAAEPRQHEHRADFRPTWRIA